MADLITSLEYTVDLDQSVVEIKETRAFVRGDSAQEITLTILRGGVAADLSDNVALLWFVRGDGISPFIVGNIVDNVVTATVTPTCTSTVGRLYIQLQLSDITGHVLTPLIVTTHVVSNAGDVIVDAEDALLSTAELIAQIDACIAATTGANSAKDAANAAAANVAAALDANANPLPVVRYDEAQSLTAPQKAQFLTNAGAATAAQGAKADTALQISGGNMTGAINEALVASMALAGTMNIGAAAGNYIIVTSGTGPITAFDSAPAGARRFMRFSVPATITYNSTTRLIPGAANLDVVSGDVLEWVSGGAGVWRCVNIERWVPYANLSAPRIKGIVSGGVVKAQATPNRTVSVSECTCVLADGKRYVVPANATLAATAAHATSPRVDIVYVSASGVLTYLAGTAAASPLRPDTPTGGMLLATITRAANDNTIAQIDIRNFKQYVAEFPRYIEGMEYLYYYHNRIRNKAAVKLIFSGDSTTYGTSLTDTNYKVDLLAAKFLKSCCVQNVTVVNAGWQGYLTTTWRDSCLATDMAAAPDLYVLRWGLNDGVNDVSTRLATYTTALRDGLKTIRASRNADNLSIILMAPNASNDATRGRDAEWDELILPVIRQAARDFQCCFVNTYNYLRDCDNIVWQDLVDDARIHPYEVANANIVSLMRECLCPTLLRRGTTSITELATQNSWVNFGPPYNNAGYYIDKNGIVHLVGMVKSGVQTLATPITEPVPAGYRLLTNKVFTVGNPLNASILVTSAGQILTYAVGNSDWLSLEGVSWAAGQ